MVFSSISCVTVILSIYCVSVISVSVISCSTHVECKQQTIQCESNDDCIVKCAGDESCHSATVLCPDTNQCTVECSGPAGCYNATIQWPSTHTGTIQCSEHRSACEGVNFPIPDPDQDFSVTCAAQWQCVRSDIYCPENANCHITCSGFQSCKDAVIHWSTNVAVKSNLSCTSTDACQGVNRPPSAPTSSPSPPPTFKCLEMIIKDDDHTNDLNGIPHVALFRNWRYRLSSPKSYIYHDREDGTFANLFYLYRSGWIMEIFDPFKNLSNRNIYQSFITDDQLPIDQWHEWTEHGGNKLNLSIECFDTYSPTTYIEIPSTTVQYASEEREPRINAHMLLFTCSLVIILLVCILMVIVAAVCCFMRQYGDDRDTWHVRLHSSHSPTNMSDGMELQSIRKETSDNAEKGYNAVPLQKPSEREIIHAVIATKPASNRGLSVPMAPLYGTGNVDSGSGEIAMTAYQTVDVYRDLDGSEESMERTNFIE